ncbi:MAG: antibiotic biosynthesis monooxygenase [Croceibacterium sp.]
MFLVVFRSRKRDDLDYQAYSAESDLMEAMAREQPGFISFKSYEAGDGEVIALSEWEDENAALAWRRVAEHSAAQSRGRSEFYEDYTLFACKHPRIHRFSRTEGP